MSAPSPGASPGRRATTIPFAWLVAAAVLVAAGATAAALLLPGASAGAYEGARRAGGRALRELVVGNEVLSWTFYALLGAILLLERLRPARPGQPLFSTAFVHDGLWFVAGACFIGAALPGGPCQASRVFNAAGGWRGRSAA